MDLNELVLSVGVWGVVLAKLRGAREKKKHVRLSTAGTVVMILNMYIILGGHLLKSEARLLISDLSVCSRAQ